MTRDGLKALIFDVDGTLADNERDGHRVASGVYFCNLTAGPFTRSRKLVLLK